MIVSSVLNRTKSKLFIRTFFSSRRYWANPLWFDQGSHVDFEEKWWSDLSWTVLCWTVQSLWDEKLKRKNDKTTKTGKRFSWKRVSNFPFAHSQTIITIIVRYCCNYHFSFAALSPSRVRCSWPIAQIHLNQNENCYSNLKLIISIASLQKQTQSNAPTFCTRNGLIWW